MRAALQRTRPEVLARPASWPTLPEGVIRLLRSSTRDAPLELRVHRRNQRVLCRVTRDPRAPAAVGRDPSRYEGALVRQRERCARFACGGAPQGARGRSRERLADGRDRARHVARSLRGRALGLASNNVTSRRSAIVVRVAHARRALRLLARHSLRAARALRRRSGGTRARPGLPVADAGAANGNAWRWRSRCSACSATACSRLRIARWAATRTGIMVFGADAERGRRDNSQVALARALALLGARRARRESRRQGTRAPAGGTATRSRSSTSAPSARDQ